MRAVKGKQVKKEEPKKSLSKFLKINDIPMQKVKSSNLHSVGYDEDSKTLQVKYNNGSVYQYFGVPKKILDQMYQAKSVGSFFIKSVQKEGQYRYRKM